MGIDSQVSQFKLYKKPGTISVDLGCGFNPRNPLEAQHVIGIDVLQTPFVEVDGVSFLPTTIGAPLPLKNSSVDVVTGYDFIEHLPRVSNNPDEPNPFIQMMNEIHRVLKPGGLLVTLTPCYPHPSTFTDPTHVNPITNKTHEYFSGHNFAYSMGYGFKGKFSAEMVKKLSPVSGVKIWESYALSSQEGTEIKVSLIKKIWRKLLFVKNTFMSSIRPKSHIIWILKKEEI